MSFRQFGGLNYSARHNIVASNYNTSNNLFVSQNVGQPNSYINFLSDISGTNIYTGPTDLQTREGVVGIGTTKPIYTLDVKGDGNFSGQVSATSFNSTSDYRIKENIEILDESHNVDNLRPVTYFNKKTEKQDIGLVAHELQVHFPYLVNGEKDGEELQNVNYSGLIALLIKEIQQLKKEMKLYKDLLHP